MARIESKEATRSRKNAALRAWREKNRARYNEYLRNWRARRKAERAAPGDSPLVSKTRTTTVEIDEAKLANVQRILGARTLREAVDRSFDEVLARAARERSIARLQRMEGLELNKRKVMARAWR